MKNRFLRRHFGLDPWRSSGNKVSKNSGDGNIERVIPILGFPLAAGPGSPALIFRLSYTCFPVSGQKVQKTLENNVLGCSK